uniref:Uncharacterized protein n=1 Tax=Lepeophtheirus salmonis TaxID=72036 RepID=A0A0K2UC32_LEPSM
MVIRHTYGLNNLQYPNQSACRPERVHRHNEQRGVVDSIRPSLPLLSL